MVRRSAPGQVPFSLGVAAVAGAAFAVGLAGLLLPVAGGVAVGAGLALGLAELATLSRFRPVTATVLGGLGPALVIVFADGVADLSLPGVVAGAAVGLSLGAAFRYAEHVIVGEGPFRTAPALVARVVVPVRDLALALGGQGLPERPRSDLPPADRGSRRR